MRVFCRRINNKGFTLLELMMVIAIIGIITIVAYPSFNTVRRDNSLYSEARKIMVDLRYMQQSAIDEQVLYEMTFNPDGAGYTIGYTAEAAVTVIETNKIENGIYLDRIEPAASCIQMGQDGAPVGGAKTIRLSNKEASYIYLYIKPAGKVELSWNAP